MAELATPAAATACAHCGAAAIGDPDADGLRFCCAGCRAARALIVGAGLTGFYRYAESIAAPAPVLAGRWDDLVCARADGQAAIAWHVGGMHCAACVWILERLPALDPGVREARVRFGDETIDVVFDPARVDATAIAATIASLGYRLAPPAAKAEARRAERRDVLARLAVSAASAMAAMHLSLNLYAGELTRDLAGATRLGFGVAAALVTVPAVAYGAAPFLRAAWGGLRVGRVGADAVVGLVVAVGLAASGVGLATGGDLYFDAIAMYVAILLAGRLALIAAKERVLRASGLEVALLPRHARRLGEVGPVEIAAAELRGGDVALVGAGEVLPADGLAREAALLDTSILTGESTPTRAPAGAPVFAGTTALEALALEVGAVRGETRFGRLLAEVGRPREAGATPEERWIVRAIPLIAIAALAVLLWWWPADHRLAARQAIAVLMVTCPCALGLGCPLLQAIATARAPPRAGSCCAIRAASSVSRTPARRCSTRPGR